MLIEFSVSNFRSIRERQTLSLVASTNNELLDTNTFELENTKLPRVVRSAVIYGPNAAGKSNFLRAIAFAHGFIINSAIGSQEGIKIPIESFAFSKLSKKEPSNFELLFAEDGVRYHYGFSVTQERVTKEWLVAYPHGKPQRWFEREFIAETGNYTWALGSNFKGEKQQQKVWRDSTRANALFLSTAINLNNDQLKPIFHWIQNKLGIVIPGQQMNLALTVSLLQDHSKRHLVEQFMRIADVGIEGLELREEDFQSIQHGALQMQLNVMSQPGTVSPKFLRVMALHKQMDSDEIVPLDLKDESDGTRKLFEYAGGWIRALQDGATILVDELDRSLHPMMTRFLVNLFHDKSRNKNGAQLVFTTHDTSLLDTELFRRDQVWFMEKDQTTSTCLYPLLDYSPRKDEALERGYLKGRYGAIPFIGAFSF